MRNQSKPAAQMSHAGEMAKASPQRKSRWLTSWLKHSISWWNITPKRPCATDPS